MNINDSPEIWNADRFKKMPDCVWTMTGKIRAYRVKYLDATTETHLEMLYLDGNERPFWGPLQVKEQTEAESFGETRLLAQRTAQFHKPGSDSLKKALTAVYGREPTP